MPAKKKAKETAAQVKTLEAQLWDAADKMRGAVPPTDYMHVCLGMVFLRYLSAAFERKENEHCRPTVWTWRALSLEFARRREGFGGMPIASFFRVVDISFEYRGDAVP